MSSSVAGLLYYGRAELIAPGLWQLMGLTLATRPVTIGGIITCLIVRVAWS